MGIVTENFPDISFIENTTIDEVLSQMVNDYQEKYEEITGKSITLGKADPYRLTIYACALQIYQTMQYVDYMGKTNLLKYSRGEWLDNLVPLRGVSREPARAATTILKFEIEAPLSSAVAIPAGTMVTNGNELYFETDDYAEIKAGETSVSVDATCTQKGDSGNGFEAGEINVMVNVLPYIVKVENTVQTMGGCETEDDESLKDRAFSAPGSYSTAGPADAYKYRAKEACAQISDVVVKSDTPGVVDVLVVLDSGEIPNDGILKQVEEYLTDRKIRPLTDKVTVSAPQKAVYNIQAVYYIESSQKASVQAIQQNVGEAVSAYNNWQSEKIGRDINPSYLVQKMMEAGVKRVVIDSPQYRALSLNEIACLGTVELNYGGLEDD